MKQPLFKLSFLIICLLGLIACNGQDEPEEQAQQPEPTKASQAEPTETSASSSNSETAHSNFQIVDISPIPDDFSRTIRNNFDRYTQVIMPNQKPVNIYAQADISDAQIVQVRNTLIFWLTDVPGSQYGADKTAVANQMGDNKATLMLLNGSDGDAEPPNLNAQPLYKNEIVVPGSAWYINNDFEHRDATFEEILHMMHDTGIGVDGENTQPGALPDFQSEIRAATNNAIANDFQIWPTGANSDRDLKSWFDELTAENSLSQEYLAAVIDSYYGLWGPFTEANAGMWGFYVAQTREDIKAKDPMGYALMEKYFSPYLTYNAQLDPSFDGTFTMTFDPSTPYTYKSQYMLKATLTGSNSANLTGNGQDNELSGNSGDNILNGIGGNNSAVYPRTKSEYTITQNEDGSTTIVGDGTDTLINIQTIVFKDQTIEANGQSMENEEPAQAQPDPAESPSQIIPATSAEFEAIMLNQLNLDSEEELYDHLDNLSDDEFLALIQTTTGLESAEEVDALLDRLYGDEEDQGQEGSDEPFGRTVTDRELVTNGELTFELQFMDQVHLPTGESVAWDPNYKQPYIDAANQWLDALVGVEGKDSHTIIIQITVDRLLGGNGVAGPSADEQVGIYTFPAQGELIIGNHTYANGFDPVEFKANILHEIGHIIGIGSYTEQFMTFDAGINGNIFRGPETNNGAEQYNAIYGTSVDFVPMSDDGGHLYDFVLQEDAERTSADGSKLPPLTKEFMANGATFGAVTLGVLDDIGYVIDYSAVENYTP